MLQVCKRIACLFSFMHLICYSLSHLIGFLMKLRNLGISDHGLIKELSSPVAGSLVSGEGHSRIYDESAVYR